MRKTVVLGEVLSRFARTHPAVLPPETSNMSFITDIKCNTIKSLTNNNVIILFIEILHLYFRIRFECHIIRKERFEGDKETRRQRYG